MKCQACSDKVSLNKPFRLGTGSSLIEVFPCKKCGRLHDKDGYPWFLPLGAKTFLIKGKIVLEENEEKEEKDFDDRVREFLLRLQKEFPHINFEFSSVPQNQKG